MEKITNYLIQSTVNEKGAVRAWEEILLLPTYEAGEEEKNPIFLEKRVYQGSSGAVYPYPVVEKITDEKKDKPYKALFLENEYLKIMILPELGGRVQLAYDKVNKRPFVYYNQVIKPALVGLTGPWISGGIEFNWPQHHRPSTFLPVDSYIEENEDGSLTIWCGEVERMCRTKGMQGFTLYPGKAYLEIKVKVYNRTPFPQTFLWWANPAVSVNDDYHSVFPPDVHAVFDHGKRDVSSFPIATGVYYKQDYSAGVDISKYKNIPVPTSYMAVQSKFDFVGGYNKDVECGLLHLANHHISPGKKQWTWGNSDFGIAWDRNLTDEDGPYIELMAGVYTDNQPDFSWLQPNEEKTWTQYFMPYSKVGYVKNATKEAIVNIETKNGKTDIILYTTAVYKNLRLLLKDKQGKIYLDKLINTSPAEPFEISVDITDDVETWCATSLPVDLCFELYTEDGRLLLEYQPEKPDIKPIPDPAKAAQLPKEIASIEQLFLTGLHLEQYRHATYNPADYYSEALRREPGDIRCNNALGLLLMRKGQFVQAEPYFRRAIETQTERNFNPYDGEPHYNLGCCLNMQGRKEEAYAAFFKATWNAAWQDPGYFALAQLDCIGARWEDAFDRVERSLIRNGHNHKARQLKASILRKLGRDKEALQWVEDSLKIDPLNMGCRFEKYLLSRDANDLQELKQLMRSAVHSYIEYALDFAAAGLYEEASLLLSYCIDDEDTVYPMVYYASGYFASLSGEPDKAKEYYLKAADCKPDKCFPNRIEEVNILSYALKINPSDSLAWYYLGTFWYAARQYEEAVACWEKSKHLNDTFPTLLRNLALAYYNKYNKKQEAKELLEKAFGLDVTDSRLFMELDQLYKKAGVSPDERLTILKNHLDLVEQRDDLYLEYVTLHNRCGEFEKAKTLLASRKFHPWEGGEGKITKQYILCHVELAKQAIENGNYQEALSFLHETDAYPHNLGEGKLANVEDNAVNYYKGIAYKALGDKSKADGYFHKATLGPNEPQQAFFYNDQQPDNIYYQGLAWAALGDTNKAHSLYNKLIAHGEKHLFDDCRIDYFAVSLPDLAIWEDDLNIRNQIHCYYVMGLGNLGLGNREKANEFLNKVKQLDINHQS
jgi:tetratricopeptide (TPR) repeat protein